MRKYITIAVMLFFAVIAWAPISAIAGEADPAIAVAEAITDGASRLSVAKTAAYADETMTRRELKAKAAALEQELEHYKTTAKVLQTTENMPISVKYSGQEKRLSGNQEVTEYMYLFNDRRHAVLTIKTATAEAELRFIKLRLSRVAEREWPCLTESVSCGTVIALTKRKNEAEESYNSTLQTIRMFVP